MKKTDAVNRAARFLAQAAAVLAGTVAVLFLLLLGAYALPGGPVRANLARSVPLLQKEGLYPEFFGFKLFQMDNYTDTIMLFEAATADETAPLTAMMTNTAYNVDNFETLPDDLALYLEKRAGQANGPTPAADDTTASSAALKPFSYARYWHGYLIWLRPLLLFFTYGQIRLLNYLAGALLLAALLWRLGKICGVRAAVWFGISQLLVTCWWVPHQLQFFTCFAIGYAACLWVLAAPRTARRLALGLIAVGAATAFMDLLVTPIVTLGLPVAVWLLARPTPTPGPTPAAPARACKAAAKSAKAGLPGCGMVVGGAACWGVGYGLCWAAKWGIAGLVTGSNVVADALHQAAVRTSADTWHGMELTWGNIFGFAYTTLAEKGLFWPVVLLAVACLALFLFSVRGKTQLAAALPLLLVASMAPAWFVILKTHSIQHGWFTWRALCVTLFAGAAFLYQSCDLPAALHRLHRLKK